MQLELGPTTSSLIAITNDRVGCQSSTILVHPSQWVNLIAPNAASKRSYFFRDVITGVILQIDTNQTFRLKSPEGYCTGAILAQHMTMLKGKIDLFHNDDTLSLVCHADANTGFCFGWFIDHLRQTSYRVLDPGTPR